ncbi:outer membrane protein [Methylocystis sp. ATCC 49242]|uniref:outer membrane protein n=1 Tax=Methylocystis sp. ATCC 49242 TaxID=622637 RepID=UPI0001F86F7F|nr:outer membrane beta-barrel protein [Methylocystis sp. ATCC 49242]
MRKIGFALTALTLAAGSAFAADFPSRESPPPAYIPPPLVWTGFHVGLNAGGTWDSSQNVSIASAPLFQGGAFGPAPWSAAAALGATGVLGASGNGGFIGGGQIGYTWQFHRNIVAGVEADIQGIASGVGGGSLTTTVPVMLPAAPFPSANTVMSASRSLDYLGTVRGRIGYLFSPTLLLYGTGGLAYGGVSLNVTGLQSFTLGTPGFITTGFGGSSFSDTRVGWSAGGGLEWMFWPNWSAKAEYLYYDLGSVRTNAGLTTTVLATGALVWANGTQAQARFDGHVVRAGVNYHFNWGVDPTVASY